MSRKLPGSAIVPGTITVTQITGGLNDTTNASYAQANTARTTANDAYGQANTARDQANTARTQANTAYDQANNARGQANTAYGQANNAYSSANLAYTQANSARSDVNTTFATVNTTFATLNTSAGTQNTNIGLAYDQANAARGQANTAYGQANAAYGAANTRLSASGGTLSGDLIITGNLTVSGNSTTLNTEILTVEDAEVVLLSNVASTPALNAGVIVNRGTSTNTFLRWNETLDEWGWSDSGTTTYYFEDLRAGLATTNTTFGTVNTSLGTINTSYQAAYAQANTAGTNALNAYGQANAAYAQANSAYGAANNRVLKAGDTMTGQLNISSGGLLVTGNVGFNTAAPQSRLEVNLVSGDNSSLMNANSVNDVTLLRAPFGVNPASASNGQAKWGLRFVGRNDGTYDNGKSAAVYAVSEETAAGYNRSVGLAFHTSSFDASHTERMRITNDGNIGAGITTPNAALHIVTSNTVNPMLRLVTPGNSLNTAVWMEDQDTNVAARAIATMDLSAGLGLFNLYAGAYTASSGNHYGSTRGASRIGMHDNIINFYTANASGAGHSTGTAITWYQTLQSSNANFIVYTNNGTERLRVDANGDFSIGITNPNNARMHVTGVGTGPDLSTTAVSNATAVFSNSDRDYGMYFAVAGNGNGAIQQRRGASAVYYDLLLQPHGGNVGIGTTSPQAKQHNYISSRSTAFSAGDGTTWHDLIIQNPNNTQGAAVGIAFELNSSYHSNAGTGIAAVKSTASSDYGADMVFVTRPQSAGAAECMRITSGGNVGIANTAPAVRLQIGNLSSVSTSSPETVSLGATFSSSAGGNPKLRVWTDGTNTIGLGVSSDQFDYIATGAYSHVFYQSGSERMRINPSGHLVPGANATYNLGSTSLRWSTVYTSDLDLSNGIGDWTIVEGEDDLFIYNNKRNKVYKFKLEEVDPATAVPKKENL